jgi:hypothetical protein
MGKGFRGAEAGEEVRRTKTWALGKGCRGKGRVKKEISKGIGMGRRAWVAEEGA